jgi:hypothetical protein
VIEILSGRFNLAKYINLKKMQYEDPDYDPNYNVIIDISKVKDIVSGNIIKDYAESIKPVQRYTRIIKAAVITATASQVAGATLYSFEDKTTDYQIFSDLENALFWIGVNTDDLKNLDIDWIDR